MMSVFQDCTVKTPCNAVLGSTIESTVVGILTKNEPTGNYNPNTPSTTESTVADVILTTGNYSPNAPRVSLICSQHNPRAMQMFQEVYRFFLI